MSRFLIALGSALLLASVLAGAALAAPKADNKNAHIIPVDCAGVGAFGAISIADNSATVFGPDGRVLVAKRISGDVSSTITTFDGAVFGPIDDSFVEGAKGKGFQGRLVECSFTEAFTETFTLDAETADVFGIPAAYVGTEATFNGTVDGTALVLMPGR
ncbi:MAG: hypothetical protein WBD55_11060 [Dehalococcoidia bacterium]